LRKVCEHGCPHPEGLLLKSTKEAGRTEEKRAFLSPLFLPSPGKRRI